MVVQLGGLLSGPADQPQVDVIVAAQRRYQRRAGLTQPRTGRAATSMAPAAEQVPELIPYDPRAGKELELTFREALRMGHNCIGTEHILLALLELEDGTGVLAGLGIDKATAEANITGAVAATLAAHEQK